MTPEVLEERLVDFAVRVITLAKFLEESVTGRTIASQVVRSGTSPAANYAEARSAESKADFVHKLRIVVKELNETSVLIRIIEKASLISANKLVDLSNECTELKRIIGASLRTASGATPLTNNQ